MVKTEGKVPGKDFAVIDVRGEDYAGGHIKGAIHQSSQTLPHGGVEEIRQKTKNVPTVIFHCLLSQVRFVFLHYLSYFDGSHSDGRIGELGAQSPPGYVDNTNPPGVFYVNVHVVLALRCFYRPIEDERG